MSKIFELDDSIYPYLKSEQKFQIIAMKALGINYPECGATFEQCINGALMLAAKTTPTIQLEEGELVSGKKFSEINSDTLKEIAALAFYSKEWITSEISIRYNPYIAEHYEDADEYFEMLFEGYFAGNQTAKYRIQLRPSMDVAIWYSYKEEKNQLLHVSNQSKIQELLTPYKAAYQQRSDAGKILEIDWASLGKLNLSADEVERFKKIVLEEQTQVQFIPKFSLKDIEDAWEGGYDYPVETKQQFIENLLNKK